MSEEMKRKLYNYEVIPPGTMWNKISAALNEEINAGFPQKLYEIEVTPPAAIWNKIVFELENNLTEFPTKLYNLEVDPPSKSWEKIISALNEGKVLYKIPSKKTIIPFVRYAAAACLIGLVTLGAIKFFNKRTTNHSVAVKTILPQESPQSITPDSKKKSSSEMIPAATNNLPKEGITLAKTNVSRKRNQQQSAGYMTQTVNPAIENASPSFTNSFQQTVLRGSIPGSHPIVSDGDPYLMFLNPDGYLIRISKKLAETLGCIYTKGNSEGYKQCEDQIKKWRDRIAQSPASSSPDNFMDILDIIKSVQDN